MAAAAVAVAVAAGAAAPPPPAPAARPEWTWLSARVALATALFVLGCAAAALAFFTMTAPSGDARFLGSCALTDAEAAGLRAASERLLLAAAGQVLAATTAVVVPALPVAALGCVLGSYTAYHAAEVLWMLVACHDDHIHGRIAFHYWAFIIMLVQALIVGVIVSFR